MKNGLWFINGVVGSQEFSMAINTIDMEYPAFIEALRKQLELKEDQAVIIRFITRLDA